MTLRLPLYVLLLGLITVAPFNRAVAGPKKHAVLVGVEDYQHQTLRTPKLKYAVDDAESLSDRFGKAGYRVTLLTDDAGREDPRLRPTKDNIESSVRAILRAAKKEDLVVIAFSGHGLQSAGQDGISDYLCPLDADPNDIETLIAVDGILQELNKSFAGTKLLILDAARNDPGPASRGVTATKLAAPDSTTIIFGCSGGEVSFEHEEVGHGVLSHAVLQGLAGEAANRSGEVTCLSLAEFVLNRVPGTVQRLFGQSAQQHPQVLANISGPQAPLVIVPRDKKGVE